MQYTDLPFHLFRYIINCPNLKDAGSNVIQYTIKSEYTCVFIVPHLKVYIFAFRDKYHRRINIIARKEIYISTYVLKDFLKIKIRRNFILYKIKVFPRRN